MAARDVMFAGVLLLGLGIMSLVGHYAVNSAVDTMMTNSVIQASTPTTDTLGYAKGLSQKADYIFVVVLIAIALGILVTGWLVGGHPIWMVAFICVVLIATVLAAILSNVWDSVSAANMLSGSLQYFPKTDNILNHLPLYIGAIGLMGMVVMFGKPYMAGDEYG